MARYSRGKTPRIRKQSLSVRDKIESDSKKAETKPKKRSVIGAPFLVLWRGLKRVLKPFSPIGRAILRVLRWLTPSYFLNAWRELRQVTWPNRRETWRLTAAVFVFALVFGGLVWVVDYGLDKIFRELVLR